LIGIGVASVFQKPCAAVVGVVGVTPDPGAGIAIGAGFVGATGVGVPAGGAGGVGVVGFVGSVGFVGFVGSVGLVVPVATFVPLLYVQPNIAAVITRIITDIENLFMGPFLLLNSFGFSRCRYFTRTQP
jgi:hypothetical protein